MRGKTALISGAATGMGCATAKRFASEGAHVVLFGLGGDILDAAAAECGGLAVHGDITDLGAIERAVTACDGKIDSLVNAVGIAHYDDPLSVSDEAWDNTMAINLTGAMRLCRAVLPQMVEGGGGTIVNIASVAAFRIAPMIAAYSASKAALVSLTQSIAHAFGPDGVRANSVAPGWIRTPMSEQEMRDAAAQNGTTMEEEFEALRVQMALKRVGTPEEIAACCLFLASDESSFVTGTVLAADGGEGTPENPRVELALD
ncbi:MAG: SDR family oxidoreductase [Pseudomonadota bacterium]